MDLLRSFTRNLSQCWLGGSQIGPALWPMPSWRRRCDMRHDNQPAEYTMTHRVAGGATERYERPEPVRDMALRLRRWSGTPETCGSCSSLPAVAVRAGMPLCSRCRAQRDIRFGRVPDM